jgi:hypothetical protein
MMKKKRIIIGIILLMGIIAISVGVYLSLKTKDNEYYFGSKKEKIVVGDLIADNIEFKETDDQLQYILNFSLTNTTTDKLVAKDYQFKVVDKKGNVLTIIPGDSFDNLLKNELTYYSFTVSKDASKLVIEKINNEG